MWKLHQWKMLKSNFISNKQEKHLKWIFRRKSKHKMLMLIFHRHSSFSSFPKNQKAAEFQQQDIGYIPRWNHSCVELGLPIATDWCLPGSHAPSGHHCLSPGSPALSCTEETSHCLPSLGHCLLFWPFRVLLTGSVWLPTALTSGTPRHSVYCQQSLILKRGKSRKVKETKSYLRGNREPDLFSQQSFPCPVCWCYN